MKKAFLGAAMALALAFAPAARAQYEQATVSLYVTDAGHTRLALVMPGLVTGTLKTPTACTNANTLLSDIWQNESAALGLSNAQTAYNCAPVANTGIAGPASFLIFDVFDSYGSVWKIAQTTPVDTLSDCQNLLATGAAAVIGGYTYYLPSSNASGNTTATNYLYYSGPDRSGIGTDTVFVGCAY